MITGNKRKSDLIKLCKAAKKLNVQINPDKQKDTRSLNERLVNLQTPSFCEPTNGMCLLPPLSIFDLYNYLKDFEGNDHAFCEKP